MALLRDILVVSPVPSLASHIKGGAQRVLAATVGVLDDLADRCVVIHSPAWDRSAPLGSPFEDHLPDDQPYWIERPTRSGRVVTRILPGDARDMIRKAGLVVVSDRYIGDLRQDQFRVLALSNLAYASEVTAATAGLWDAVWVPSEYPHRPVDVIQPALDRHYLATLRSAAGLDGPAARDRPRYLFFPHRCDPGKGLLDALALAERLVGLDHRWRMIVVRPSELDDRANQAFFACALNEARTRGIAGLVMTVSWQKHQRLPVLYAKAACTLMASRLPEGLGLVPIESVVCGTPAVVHATGALSLQRSRLPSLHLVLDIDSPATARTVHEVAQQRVGLVDRRRVARMYSHANHARQVRSAVGALLGRGRR
ncbi:MAG: glycosyltransferase [Pseudonocardiaceae bacterium]